MVGSARVQERHGVTRVPTALHWRRELRAAVGSSRAAARHDLCAAAARTRGWCSRALRPRPALARSRARVRSGAQPRRELRMRATTRRVPPHHAPSIAGGDGFALQPPAASRHPLPRVGRSVSRALACGRARCESDGSREARDLGARLLQLRARSALPLPRLARGGFPAPPARRDLL